MYFFITCIRREDNENMNVTQTLLSTTEVNLHMILFWNIRVQHVLEKYYAIVPMVIAFCNSFVMFGFPLSFFFLNFWLTKIQIKHFKSLLSHWILNTVYRLFCISNLFELSFSVIFKLLLQQYLPSQTKFALMWKFGLGLGGGWGLGGGYCFYNYQ